MKLVSFREAFSFPATRSGGGERGITPDRNKRMFRRKIGDERAYLVLNLCSNKTHCTIEQLDCQEVFRTNILIFLEHDIMLGY